jgi:hypothetical protein
VPDGHLGPLCGTAENAWAQKLVPFFDRGSDDNQGSVLPIDLSSLVNSDYTVFVVERRRSAARPAYLLGSTPPDINTAALCGSLENGHKAFRFGYLTDSLFVAGSLAEDEGGDSCLDIGVLYPPFVTNGPAARLDVEVLSANTRHVFYPGTGAAVIGDDSHAIESLEPGLQYLGRANQPITIDPEHPDARFYGDIAEVVIYDAALSDADRLAVSGYLMDRWQVTNPPP